MNKYKFLSISIIVVLFIVFVLINSLGSNNLVVLKVYSPFEIVVDKNKNGVEDDGEKVKLDYNLSYITNESDSDELVKKLSLDDAQRFVFSYLTNKFVTETLLDKKVCFKLINNKEELFVNNDKYSNILQKSGYFFKDNAPINKQSYDKRLAQIAKADYRIYNVKSNKYHLLSCEYGRMAHNYIILSKSALPKGAKPCGYCLSKNKPPKTNKKSLNRFPLVYSSGAIKVFMVDYTNHLIPNRAGNTEICRELVRQIDNAKSSIDIAIYGYDCVPKIEQAIKRAQSRGVKIRLVHDIDMKNSNIYAHTHNLAALISSSNCDRPTENVTNKSIYTNSIMHNKFYIFDNSTVITGSANLSFTDMSDYNCNSVLLINSKKIANIFTQEFEQMYNSKFHNLKTKIPDKENIVLGSSKISVYFSPADKAITNVIVPVINKSKRYVYVPVFLITDGYIANALVSAKRRGVDVKVIVDATNAGNSYSKHKYLRQNGVLVKTENYAGKMHSKSIIIDDKYTIIGSMNFSKSGNTRNDENLVLIEDAGITKFYRLFFNYLWSRINNYWLTHDVSSESLYSIGSCYDGIDNDYDGKTDSDDEGCRFKPIKALLH